MTLSLAISPCPNDTLMFDALVNAKCGNDALTFATEFADIEQLNRGLLNARWDVAKMSVAMFSLVRDEYVMLTAGMAMGFGNGPLVVSHNSEINLGQFVGKMLIPGQNTTANLLLSRFFPNITDKEELLFSDILQSVANRKALAGLIIHESRFTYRQYNLYSVADMGEIWCQQTQLPLPLGCIVARRSLGKETILQIESLIRQSIKCGLENRAEALPFIQHYAQELDTAVVNSHIDLYVNKYSVNPGKDGLNAVLTLLRSAPENHSLSLSDIFATWEK
ncbi:MAG: 1,4-dihydroxy-6-naphthoate synthase [Bacteroidetes bacterium HGW-Bacteroidetes-6]|jgi:1,4-dihydroxy-6-naphthoate synthase|nr:MAG: 1,4-dihydroxy-6-naphthoate synthase [Bacteroidetes bacterium HGW-Bacteroidetes-6]